jgi:hypothetical protein
MTTQFEPITSAQLNAISERLNVSCEDLVDALDASGVKHVPVEFEDIGEVVELEFDDVSRRLLAAALIQNHTAQLQNYKEPGFFKKLLNPYGY